MAWALPNPLPGLGHPTDNHEGSCRSWFPGFSSVLISRAATPAYKTKRRPQEATLNTRNSVLGLPTVPLLLLALAAAPAP